MLMTAARASVSSAGPTVSTSSPNSRRSAGAVVALVAIRPILLHRSSVAPGAAAILSDQRPRPKDVLVRRCAPQRVGELVGRAAELLLRDLLRARDSLL